MEMDDENEQEQQEQQEENLLNPRNKVPALFIETVGKEFREKLKNVLFHPQTNREQISHYDFNKDFFGMSSRTDKQNLRLIEPFLSEIEEIQNSGIQESEKRLVDDVVDKINPRPPKTVVLYPRTDLQPAERRVTYRTPNLPFSFSYGAPVFSFPDYLNPSLSKQSKEDDN